MKNWIANATKNKGGLHRMLNVPEGTKITAKKLGQAIKSNNPLEHKRAILARTLSKFNKK